MKKKAKKKRRRPSKTLAELLRLNFELITAIREDANSVSGTMFGMRQQFDRLGNTIDRLERVFNALDGMFRAFSKFNWTMIKKVEGEITDAQKPS